LEPKSKRQFPSIPYFLSLIEWPKFKFTFTQSRLDRAVTIQDIASIAKRRVPKVVYDYVEGAAMDEISYKRSRDAFASVEFTAHALRDVSQLDTSTDVLGTRVALPIFFAPTGYTRFMYHVGEPTVATVAANHNLIYTLSTMGTTSPQELARSTPNSRRWFQLYIMQKRENTLDIINQARDSGFEALVVTVDTPVSGLRFRDIRNGLTIPPRIRIKTIFAIARKPLWWINLLTTKKLEFAAFRGWNKSLGELANQIFDPRTTLADISWLQDVWKGPVIVKGIANVEDALAVAHLGVQGIIISNHGGRQLDRGPVPLELLPKVVDAVGERVEIFIDGGIMSGSDAYAAIALGAKGVFIGRAYLYGIMAGGQAGVEKVIEILERDFRNTMALTGATNLKEIREFGARLRSQ
jgi:isopentenyl diphosphate isomerase/L-lactate dehydrogenase-like FMN-dependent dehydrogenase